MHEVFDEELALLTARSGIGADYVGEVLARIARLAPREVTRVELAAAPSHGGGRAATLSAPSVSRAVKALTDRGFVAEGTLHLKGSSGRPAAPLRLGDTWLVAGVKVEHQHGSVHGVTVVLSTLDQRVVRRRVHHPVPAGSKLDDALAGHIAAVVLEVWQEHEAEAGGSVALLGLGIEIGALVDRGVVKKSTNVWHGDEEVPLAALVQKHLGYPVEVENDVNALAVWELYRDEHDDADVAVVAVFEEGVGGGLVLDGALRRGGHGMTMEIGHLRVDDVPQDREASTGFRAPCACGQLGHVDAVATPARIEAELGVTDWRAEAQRSDATAIEVFAHGGRALGQALASLATITDPTRLVLYLPSELAEPAEGTAGWSYLEAVRGGMRAGYFSFSLACDEPQDIRAVDADDVAELGARAAALCVLHAFIEHARGRDSCMAERRARLLSTGT